MNRGILALPSFPRTATLETSLGFTLHGPIFNCDPHPGNILVDKETGPPGPPFFDVTQVGDGDMPNMWMPMKRKNLLSGPFRYSPHLPGCKTKLSTAHVLPKSDEPTPCALWTGRLCVLDWGQVRQLSQPERYLPGCINFPQPLFPHLHPRVWRSSPFFTCFFTMIKFQQRVGISFCLLIIFII